MDLIVKNKHVFFKLIQDIKTFEFLNMNSLPFALLHLSIFGVGKFFK